MTPPPKLEPGSPDDDYPVNEQGSADFKVGGVRRTLPQEQQLEQLDSYIGAHYPAPDFTPPWKGGGDPDPADRYTAQLPDRLTHASMLMLGSAVDHTMPGVAYAGGVEVEDVADVGGRLFTPSDPTGRWAVSLHSGAWWRGSGEALEHQWRPEVAAAAELSGTIILDLDYPLAPMSTVPEISAAVEAALGWALHHNPVSVACWGYSSGAALAALNCSRFDALALTFPDLDSVANLPEEIRGGAVVPGTEKWPRTLVQLALQDEIAARPEGLSAEHVEVREYVSKHRISTPEVARERTLGVAEFLRSV